MSFWSLALLLSLAVASCSSHILHEELEADFSTFQESDGKKKFIVYTGARNHDMLAESLVLSHQSLLASVLGDAEAHTAMVHTYKHGFSGFSAWLTESQAQSLSDMPGVVQVFPSRILKPLTTRSWEFLHDLNDLREPSWLPPAGAFKEDVIIGVVDTGIWPESQSFSDEGFGPVPARWKGGCDNTGVVNSSEIVHCNRKLIGAKVYALSPNSTYKNARDSGGHGTHTSSTAAGNPVTGANMFGLGNGTARGGLPSARLAMYKVCFDDACFSDSVLAAFDDAIHDGVDVLSLSLGVLASIFTDDVIAIGSFHAAANGIVVSCAGGNFGPWTTTVLNVAPWILTVGASTIDRRFSVRIKLGNGETMQGTSLNLADSAAARIIPGADAAKDINNPSASFCVPDTLDAEKVRGNVLVCVFSSKSFKRAGLAELGAAGVVFQHDIFSEVLVNLGIPGTFVTNATYSKILEYSKTRNATASFTATRTIVGGTAPAVARFSSRGPNPASPEILKPDVVAPGVNILAAWPTNSLKLEGLSTGFYILSGTSMATPHASGAAAYLKSLHPDWSPAAIKSALMTTATTSNNKGSPIKDHDLTVASPFACGAGEINPTSAANPGLVYDAGVEDYLAFLCASGYDSTEIEIISGTKNVTCSHSLLPENLNYPSISIPRIGRKITIRRTVTNVGPANSSYKAEVHVPKGVKAVIIPPELKFSSTGQKHEYRFTLKASKELRSGEWHFGYLTWSSEAATVRSQIAYKA